jgi:predicted small lipoprotein YifL
VTETFLRCLALLVSVFALVACGGRHPLREPPIDPDVARANIDALLPAGVANRSGWTIDIYAAFESLQIAPTNENICAVVAVTQQESTFQVKPVVAGLATIARKEISTRAERYHVPNVVVRAALELTSPTGKSYRERIDAVRTEDALSDVFEDFIGMVPLGKTLFADWNPVRTGGPMQVSIAFAEEHAREQRYPYPVATDIRDAVFTRRGGMYFGIAHLLDYPAPYADMLYRFADFNAGHFASRNAAFQNAVAKLSKTTLALDGDLVLHGSSANDASKTELATRSLTQRLELSESVIRRDLERGAEEDLAATRTYTRVFELAEQSGLRALPRAVVPQIRLQSAKITRKLTTEWFANRVNDRYGQCLARARKLPRK